MHPKQKTCKNKSESKAINISTKNKWKQMQPRPCLEIKALETKE